MASSDTIRKLEEQHMNFDARITALEQRGTPSGNADGVDMAFIQEMVRAEVAAAVATHRHQRGTGAAIPRDDAPADDVSDTDA